jgi:hypothetical protein
MFVENTYRLTATSKKLPKMYQLLDNYPSKVIGVTVKCLPDGTRVPVSCFCNSGR